MRKPTQKQIEAARRNGAKSLGHKTPRGKQTSAANSALSTGPTTPAGKSISARNATRHGLLADLYEELQPVTPIECRIVEVMAVLDWRRMRICPEANQ